MLLPIYERLKLAQNFTVLRGVHWAAKGILKLRGFEWEIRRSGEVKLGYWKKVLRKRDRKSAFPKRFVVMPGLGDSSLSWYSVLVCLQPLLKRHFDEVILIDFPGFGGFLSHERAFPSIDLMISVLNDTLDSLKPHTIVGHSLGGWLAALYAADCGAGIRPASNQLIYQGPQDLFLVSPSGIFSDQLVRENWEALFRSAMQGGFRVLRPHLFVKEPFWFKYIENQFHDFLSREDVLQFMGTFRDEHSVEGVAHQIRSRVSLVWGEKDSLIPFECAAAWLEYLQTTKGLEHRAVILKGIGHSPQVESPLATALVIGQLLVGRIPHESGKRWWKVLEHNLTT